MKLVNNCNFTVETTNQPFSYNAGNYQVQNSLKTSKVIDFFEYLYSYPPKFTLKWNAIDELTQDLFLEQNYGVLQHSFPFINVVEDTLFKSTPQITEPNTYAITDFINGYLNKIYSSDFYNKKTKEIQDAVASVPIFLVLNGNNEIVLGKPINFSRAQAKSRPVEKNVYDYCGAFDPLIESNPKLGFFFLSRTDAETYMQEVAKTDMDGTKTVGLSLHCIGLNSAYKVTREHHPGVDFRFVPDYQEIKKLLKNRLSDGRFIIEDEQQQLRFRPRNANLLPFLGKIGNWVLPTRSFLQKNEYFKGVPIYIVQLRTENRNALVEQGFNTIDKIDSTWGRLLQFYDTFLGFGQNWIMQGSLKKEAIGNDYSNIVFLNEQDALNYIKENSRKVARYSGSRTSNVEFMVRKPKIYVYNLEDFLDSWEEKLLMDPNEETSKTIFNAENTFFVPSKAIVDDLKAEANLTKKAPLQGVTQTLNLRYRLFKRYIGFLFSVGYT